MTQMFKNLYAVYDTVAEEITGPVMVLPNDAAARRIFQDALTGQGSNLATHPKDYELVFLGNIDMQTGELKPADPEMHAVVTGASVILGIERWAAEREKPPVDPDQLQIPE